MPADRGYYKFHIPQQVFLYGLNRIFLKLLQEKSPLKFKLF